MLTAHVKWVPEDQAGRLLAEDISGLLRCLGINPMIRFDISAIVLFFVAFSLAAQAASPPSALLGKSVVTTWVEKRTVREVGKRDFRTGIALQNYGVYISTSGRIFVRFNRTVGSETASSEYVVGEKVQGPAPDFSGRTMTVLHLLGTGGIQRLAIDFAPGFSSCTARVTYAKEAGKTTSIVYSAIGNKMVEMLSRENSNEKCSVQNGNIFGGQ
jgi:hypothetical protein